MKELAARLHVTAAAVDHYEGGRRTPDPAMVDAFVRACGRQLVFAIVEPTAQMVALDPVERELVTAWRAASPERSAALAEFARLLQHARPGAEGAALAVLRSLQEAPAAPARTAAERG